MSVRYLFVLRDRKTDMVGPIMEFGHPVDAVRAVPELLGQDSLVRRHPADFELVQVAKFDQAQLAFVSDVSIVGSVASLAAAAAPALVQETLFAEPEA
jgi:hypothetical protein